MKTVLRDAGFRIRRCWNARIGEKRWGYLTKVPCGCRASGSQNADMQKMQCRAGGMRIIAKRSSPVIDALPKGGNNPESRGVVPEGLFRED